ncbi:hypothetical protein A3Q56_04804 [Intoshia linei]|uniref:Uncharacterized protein n=1 Tax=Intoshia linei TaxID=1819745 RepID=A0A177B015_9BILA|nr:hypothetical protein A3Q56_04804 [Intoshia linei]
MRQDISHGVRIVMKLVLKNTEPKSVRLMKKCDEHRRNGIGMLPAQGSNSYHNSKNSRNKDKPYTCNSCGEYSIRNLTHNC